MPTATAPSIAPKQTNFNQLIKHFTDKCKEFSVAEQVDYSDLWEFELKQISRRLFTLLPLELYNELVFSVLEDFLKIYRGSQVRPFRNNSSSKSGSLGSIGHKLRSLSLAQSHSGPMSANKGPVVLVIKCLELMVDCDKLKHFRKDLFDSMWNCVQLILNHEVCFEFNDELTKIFEKLAETHQFILIKRIIGVINESFNIEILKTIFTFTSKIKLKLYPEESFEDSMNFIEEITKISFDPQKQIVCGFLATLLINLRQDCEADFLYPKFNEGIASILDRFHPLYLSNFKITEFQAKLVASVLCLGGPERFLARFDEIFIMIITKIREKLYTSDALFTLNTLLSTYYTKYSDSWATILERTEFIFTQIFPDGRKNVLGCEQSVNGVVRILQSIATKIPRFCYNEVIKRLLKQCIKSLQNSSSIDNFPWDRANIALQTYLYLCSTQFGKNNAEISLSWSAEYSKMRIGDLEMKYIDEEVASLIKSVVQKVCKQFWQAHLNEIVINSSRYKLLNFIEMILKRFTMLIELRSILKFTESGNISTLQEAALQAWDTRRHDSERQVEALSHELVHKISNMIFGQNFKVSRNMIESDPVYNYFEACFCDEFSENEIPDPPEDLEENEVLRGGIYFLLESLNSWSQTKLLDPTTVKLDRKEIDLFGKVVDVYFKLLTRYESLVKAVYLERQGDRNILLRSWSSLVGFRRNSKEIADFLVSILGYSDENLRKRVIESFRFLPMQRMSEFMKLLERYRLVVSEDFVNLKPARKGRRNEKSKVEITRVYQNLLKAWTMEENALTPLKMILRHVVELYYYVSKSDLVDAFIWKLRVEFVSLLREYLRVVNFMGSGLRKSFFPLKFHLEVWLTCDEWCNSTKRDSFEGEEIEGFFVNCSLHLLTAVSCIDRASLPKFIENLLVKISEMADSNLQSKYAYNLLESSRDEEHFGLLIEKMIEFIGSRGDVISFALQKGIQEFLAENVELTENTCDPSLILFRLMHSDSQQILQSTDPGILVKVIDLLQGISDATIQRRLLFRLQGPLSEIKVVNSKIIQMLLKLSERLLETFPNSLKYLWQILVLDSEKRKEAVGLIVHELMACLQNNPKSLKSVALFVYTALDERCREYLLKTALQYSHPFSGTRIKYKISPLQAVLIILTEGCVRVEQVRSSENVVRMKVLLLLFVEEYAFDASSDLLYEELLLWAVQCPLNEVSLRAWRVLKDKYSHLMSNEFIQGNLLGSTRHFLQHLVCPATLTYFDPLLVGESMKLFIAIVKGNPNISKESVCAIFDSFLVQLSASDQVVHETCCELLQACFECQKFALESGDEECNGLLQELAKRSGEFDASMDLLYFILEEEVKEPENCKRFLKFGSMIDRYLAYLTGLLPFIFTFFEENLVHNVKKSDSNVDEYEEMRYLRMLIVFGRALLVEEGQVDVENGRMCLLELEEFLISIERMKMRSSIDFYKSIANLLADPFLRGSSLRSIENSLDALKGYEEFLLFYFDALRVGKCGSSIKENFAFKVANVFATCDEGSNELRQRVIDFLIC